MNNQEAISVLESINAKTDYFLINDNARAEAIDMAISAFQAQDVPDTNVGDTISRQAAIDIAYKYKADIIAEEIEELPSAQPEPMSEAYTKAVFTWLLEYQIKAAELNGRYTPYEVLSWVANDWRKENGFD